MSHGISGGNEKADPNLTPLLDVVLQLLMFFMMCVNFVTEQVSEDIQLPVASSARPMDKRETDFLYLNLNRDGKLEVPGRDQPFVTTLDKKVYLNAQYQDTKRSLRANHQPEDVKTSIVIRADKNVEYKDVYELMRLCREVGYRRLQVRAMTKGGVS
jgi:biopolymer transport protein ExbD